MLIAKQLKSYCIFKLTLAVPFRLNFSNNVFFDIFKISTTPHKNTIPQNRINSSKLL